MMQSLPWSKYSKVPDIPMTRERPALIFAILDDLRDLRPQPITIHRYVDHGRPTVIKKALEQLGIKIYRGAFQLPQELVEFWGLNHENPNWRLASKIIDISPAPPASTERRTSVERASNERRTKAVGAQRIESVPSNERRTSVERASNERQTYLINKPTKPITNNPPTPLETIPVSSDASPSGCKLSKAIPRLKEVWPLTRGKQWNQAMVDQVMRACLSGDDPVSDCEAQDLVAACEARAKGVKPRFVPDIFRFISSGEWRTCVPAQKASADDLQKQVAAHVLDLIDAFERDGESFPGNQAEIWTPDSCRPIGDQLHVVFNREVAGVSAGDRLYGFFSAQGTYEAVRDDFLAQIGFKEVDGGTS